MNELDEKTGPIDDKGTAGPGVGQGRTIAQSGSAQQKGIGKESQLSKIAAAVNPGSMTEASPTATQSMISTFMKTFESSAIEMREDTNDDQKELIKTMIDEITKLQTKNMSEFEKAIGKIVGITKELQNSNNPILQKLGKEMEEKSREEVVKASGYTLTGEKDTFLNRLGRSVGMNTEEEPLEKNKQGIGKLAKGFGSSIGGTLKRGFNIAVGREAPEGSFADSVFTSDEQKRERLMSRIDSETNKTQSVSASDTFKKVIEEYFKEEKQKSDSSEKQKKSSPSVNSEGQEDTAGISKDATIEALQKTAESNVLIQQNTSETVDVLKQILEQMKNMPVGGGVGGGGGDGGDDGGMDIDLPDRRRSPRRSRGRLRARARMASRAVKGSRAGGIVRGLVNGARSIGGQGINAITSGARAITAPMAVAGTAAIAATGSILYGVDKFIKSTNIGARKEQEEGTAKFGLTGNNMDGFFINGKPAGKYKDLPEYYQKVADGYGANSRGGAAERAREYVKTHNPDGSKKTEKKPAAVEKDKKKTDAKVTPTTPAKQVTTPPPAKAEEIVVTAPKKKAEVEKPKQEKSTATSTAKEAIEPKKKDAAPSLDAVDKSIKGKVSEIDPNGRWAKLKDGKIVDPDFPNDADSNNSAAAAYKLSQKAGKVEGKGNQTGDLMSPKKTTGKTETGKNIDGALIEQGTAETKDKVQVNVPPPTVINQGGGGQAQPQITFPGGVGNVRTNDSSWQRFQDRRAVG
jgi:hypothetical protein